MHYHYQICRPFYCGPLWHNLVYSHMCPLVPTLSLTKPNSGLSWGKSSKFDIPNCLKMFQNKISAKLPWSISVFLTIKLVISTLITTESSWSRSIALKSIEVKVISDMFGALCGETMFTGQTYCRCLFRIKVVVSLLANPLTMVLMTHLNWSRDFSSLSLDQLWLLRLLVWEWWLQSLSLPLSWSCL